MINLCNCKRNSKNDENKFTYFGLRNDEYNCITISVRIPRAFIFSITRTKTDQHLSNLFLIQNGCSQPKEGFNFGDFSLNGAKVRIGMIGYRECKGEEAESRIGFGTEGSSGGMDPNNTCGNAAAMIGVHNNTKSIKAFCYILIK